MPAISQVNVRVVPATQEELFPADSVQQLFQLAVSAGQCLKCGRPGRQRPTLVESFPRPVACDLCWHSCGGAEGLAAVVAGEVPDPFPARSPVEELRQVDDGLRWDDLHPVDQFLIESGIGWGQLRWVPRPARVALALNLKTRRPPEGTQAAESRQLWLDEVLTRIACSIDFHQDRSRRTCYSVAEVYAWDRNRTGRPLAWMTHETVGEAIGKSSKTVQRSVHWFLQQELMHEVVPGLKLPRMSLPENPTADERAAARTADEERMAAAEQAEAAAMARARAELELVATGLPRREAVLIAALRHPAPAVPQQDEKAGFVFVAPVYELRVPIPAEVLAERAAIERAQREQRCLGLRILDANRDQYIDVRNALALGRHVIAVGSDGTLAWVTADELLVASGRDAVEGSLTCANVVGFLRGTENVHPPLGLFNHDQFLTVLDVDKRPASPGSWTSLFRSGPQIASPARKRPRRRPDTPKGHSGTQRQAEELRRQLDPALAEIPVRSLEALIRPWLAATWSVSSILRRIHGQGVPTFVHSPTRYVRHRLKDVPQGLSPDQRDALQRKIDELDTENRRAAQHRVDVEARMKRQRIADCDLCDEYGWVVLDEDQDVVARCNHDSVTGGW